ncbi:MAG TPA: hypothetical protein VGO22_02140 [Pseudorhizobium sp.]|nr:hypothetical protein [Pseudorhizobium sp.]
MNLRVIEGGRETTWEVPGTQVAALEMRAPQAGDVRLEADRRLKRLNYDHWRNRQIVAGIAIPREIRYLAMQIEFVAERLGALEGIPLDYRSDVYWPG